MSVYRVQLEIFSGPLDLLLYLVRRHEVAVADLPIASIAAQFLEFLEVLEFIDLDLVGDFLVLASALVELKSREALPRAEDDSAAAEVDAPDEARSELIQQLMQYKKYKDAAGALQRRADEWQERFPRLNDDRPARSKDPSADRIKEVELWDLVSALSRVLERKVVEESSSIRLDDTPLSAYMERISERVRREGRVAFSQFFEHTHRRSRIVGVFLAILELLRHHGFHAEQPEIHGEIWISPPWHGPPPPDPDR